MQAAIDLAVCLVLNHPASVADEDTWLSFAAAQANAFPLVEALFDSREFQSTIAPLDDCARLTPLASPPIAPRSPTGRPGKPCSTTSSPRLNSTIETVDGLSQLWAVNVLGPYVLTALMPKPERLVYLSSGMHLSGDATLDDLQWSARRWNGSQAYADTKLHDVLLAFGVARRWPTVLSNALTPGWVPTRMDGSGAPDDLDQEHRTQAWLAVSDEPSARVSGRYFYHQRQSDLNPATQDVALQDRLLECCRALSGVALE